MLNKTIGNRLKNKRTAVGISQKQIAELLDVSKSTVQNYEAGKTPIPVEIVISYAELCKISPAYFLTGTADYSLEEINYLKEQILFYKEKANYYQQKIQE